jgi:hypothetical protein
LPLVPAFDLRAQPEARAAGTEVEHGPWHVGIAPEIQADRVAVGESEDPSNVVRVNEVVQCHPTRHVASLHGEADACLHA